jgi:hypothetical protein
MLVVSYKKLIIVAKRLSQGAQQMPQIAHPTGTTTTAKLAGIQV